LKPVIIIGMHRSGTSLIVKILEELGVFMGADQEKNNESLFFIEINKWIFQQAYSSWEHPEMCRCLSEEAKETLIPIIKNRLTSYHKKRYFGSIKPASFENINFHWGWKDPRNTFTIDIWQKIFGDVKIIHIHRNPLDVIASLYKRENKLNTNVGNPTGTGIKKKLYGLKLPKKNLFLPIFRFTSYDGLFRLWKEYVSQALSISNDSKEIIHLSYEELITNPQKKILELTTFLEIESKNILREDFFDIKRKNAFLNNPELVEFYKKIKDDALLIKLNYGDVRDNNDLSDKSKSTFGISK